MDFFEHLLDGFTSSICNYYDWIDHGCAIDCAMDERNLIE